MNSNIISVIVPFYYGNDYINNLIENINNCCLNTTASFEMIIVNDSPEVMVKYKVRPKFYLKIINNNTNKGIQWSRIHGLKNAQGEYIIFLDQDDELISKNIDSQLKYIKKSDICVGNGIIERNNKQYKIFKNKFSQKHSVLKKAILKYGTTIVSPGQCLIRRKSIPSLWINTPLKINGADDEFLWLLMILKKKKFTINNNEVYIHKDTGKNLSLDYSKMAKSSLEYANVLYSKKMLSKSEYQIFKRRRTFKIQRYESKNKLIIDFKFLNVSMYALFIKCLNWL